MLLAMVFLLKVTQSLLLAMKLSWVVTLSQPMFLLLALSSGGLFPQVKVADPQGPYTRNNHPPTSDQLYSKL